MGLGSKSELRQWRQFTVELNRKWTRRVGCKQPSLVVFRRLPSPGTPFRRRVGWLDRKVRQHREADSMTRAHREWEEGVL